MNWRFWLSDKTVQKFDVWSGSLCPKNNFRSEFMEISKAVHFWKAYNVRNPKTNVYICAETQVAAILDFQNGTMKYEYSNIFSFYCHINLIQKVHMANRIVTSSTTSRDLERSRSWPQYVWGSSVLPAPTKRFVVTCTLPSSLILYPFLSPPFPTSPTQSLIPSPFLLFCHLPPSLPSRPSYPFFSTLH